MCWSVFLTDYKWRMLSRELRKELLKCYDKSHYVNQYVMNVTNLLRSAGEPELAEKLQEEIENMMENYKEYGRMKL